MVRLVWGKTAWLAIAAVLLFVTACASPTAAPPEPGGDEAQAVDTAEVAEAPAPQEETDTALAVGSKDFTEEFLVAEMYALLLEDAGFEVERKLNLGGTPIAHQAILDGDIDLYPEYSSTGLLTVLGMEPMSDAEEIVETVRREYEERFDITWLQPAPFNNSQALATTRAVAEEYGLETYSDLAEQAGQLVLGGPAEFTEREDGLPGLQAEYGGFEFEEYVQLGTGPLRYDALQEGRIDVVVAFGTDGRIAGDDLVVLEDDRNYYPVYQIAPVVRLDTLAGNGRIADVLNQLAPLLTDQVMSRLNYEVDVAGREYPDVALEFLQESGLLGS